MTCKKTCTARQSSAGPPCLRVCGTGVSNRKQNCSSPKCSLRSGFGSTGPPKKLQSPSRNHLRLRMQLERLVLGPGTANDGDLDVLPLGQGFRVLDDLEFVQAGAVGRGGGVVMDQHPAAGAFKT